ncbi:DICT sensory domain-containing protein [Leptothoe sp. ISB3NOV94-8A]|uniref:Histidine kinase n=1 Tax=Adonisia turfae CCMR0081 TaxID=2292702 RepID=A0A6M0RSV8_9CYAN|nr:HD domain-containing phosphohydrolase [Adonisia turfae]MDV3347503.1 DICT sensory domain-containing protein [Leptothoe sp. LEGE 181152]NEZ59344.1 histidine kinase [Adonisia turfae CCMR0081]
MNSEATLNQLKTILPEGQMPSSYGVYFKNTLVALCHALEDHILEHSENDQPLVLVTFQQGKWYLQEAERYRDIAHCSQQVAIAAVPDSGFGDHATSQLDNVDMVNLQKDDSLTKEWNLIILAPGYASMVLCHELSDDEYRSDSIPTTDAERKFYGLWTFDRGPVEAAAKILIERMQPYSPALADQLMDHYNRLSNNPSDTSTDLSGVVARIVNYLQSSQQQLVTVSRQTRELWELEGQASKLNRNLAANKLQAFLRMVQKIDERDVANPTASLQVSALAETLGQLLDLPTLQLRRLRLAGLLFRIGLAEAPKEIFKQTAAQLDKASLVFWRDRAALGGQLLSSMPELAPISRIVTHQLEYWDGSGTPDGLKAEEIPIESRILGLVSYFQELTEARGDRAAMSLGDALTACENHSDRRFDPKLVESLSTVVRLAEIGMLQLPERPSQQPTVWLEDLKPPATEKKHPAISKEVTS